MAAPQPSAGLRRKAFEPHVQADGQSHGFANDESDHVAVGIAHDEPDDQPNVKPHVQPDG